MKEFVDLEGLRLFLELFKEALANNGTSEESSSTTDTEYTELESNNQ